MRERAYETRLQGIKIHLGCRLSKHPRDRNEPQAESRRRIDIEIYATDLTNNAVKSCQSS